MTYTCKACNRVLVTKRTEALEDGTFPEVIPYVSVIRPWPALTCSPDGDCDTFTMYGTCDHDKRGDAFYCCADCGEPSRGKVGAYTHSRNDTGKVRTLYALALEGMSDDEMGQEDRCNMLGTFLLFTDYYGALTFEEYDSAKDAYTRYDFLYGEGMGAQEDDAYIHDRYGRDVSVMFDGKPLKVAPNAQGLVTLNRARAAVRIEAARTGYYPNLWIVDHSGSLTLSTY